MNPYFKTEDTGTIYDIFDLFQYYNAFFFGGLLQKCTVRWAKRMTLCAGTCKYEGFGSSTISLSEPLLKFRTSNELKETLLHEMIHAYLFITDPESCKVQGGHGPPFISMMETINATTGLRLTVYHNFKDEVEHYRQHIWRCNGKCKNDPPYYGYVKRSMNRKPQPADHWFKQHKRICGGQFIKISSPERSKSRQSSLGEKKKKPRKSKKKIENVGSWGGGKTIDEYLKQMQRQSIDKKEKLKKIKEEKQEKQEKRPKTISEYCYEIEKQREQLQKQGRF